MGNDKIFGLSFDDMKNVSVNKNDIIIETGLDEVGNDDCMCEIRFYVDEQQEENEQQEEENEEEK
jgi:hypothetical protein